MCTSLHFSSFLEKIKCITGIILICFALQSCNKNNIESEKLRQVAFNTSELKLLSPLDESRAPSFDITSKVMIHFWATWCAPCLEEIPILISFAQKKKGIVFYFIAVDDEKGKVKKYLQQFSLPQNIIVLFDDGKFSKKLGTTNLPESYFFQSNGQLILKYIGRQDWNSHYFIQSIK